MPSRHIWKGLFQSFLTKKCIFFFLPSLFLLPLFETNSSVGPVKKSIQPEVEPEVPEAVGIEPEVLPDLSGMLARKIGDNIQKYPKPAEQNS